MKTIRNEFKKITDYQNLMEAYKKARKGKRNKKEVQQFEYELNYNLYSLKIELDNHSYQIRKYREFKVYEPKERDVMALSFRDRIVQHSLCDNVLEPYLNARLDYDNAACRNGKGTHFALNRLKLFMKKAYNSWGCDYYVLKCDIRKYFSNIDHEILKTILFRCVEDEDIIWLLNVIIDSTSGKTGLPIGNMTSQWFAIFYLHEMDQYIRNELHIQYYTRYMDDFLILHSNKKYLKECKEKISVYLKEERGLELNEKTQIFPIKNGVDYLGFHSYLTETGKIVRKIRKKSKRNMQRKLKYFNQAYSRGEIDIDKIKASIVSWSGHAKHGNTYNLRKKIYSKLKL